MKIARANVGIPSVSGFLVLGNQCALLPSVFLSTELNLAMLGPRSVMVINWAPSSDSVALLDICPAISAPAPIRRPAPRNLVPDLKLPHTVFLPFLAESLLVSLHRMNLILKSEFTPGPLESSDFLFLKLLDPTHVNNGDDGRGLHASWSRRPPWVSARLGWGL